MKLIQCVLIAVMAWSSTARADESTIQRFGMYVVVADLERSRQFYSKLFQKSAYVTNDKLIGFDVAAGLYVAFAAKGLDRPLQRGDNAVPYLRVKDLEAEFKRVKELPAKLIDAAIVREGPSACFVSPILTAT